MEQEIRRRLAAVHVVGREILCFEQLDSTNTHAKRLALEGAANGTVVIAEHQTAGRGRMDRSFQSPKGRGLYLTVLLRPNLPPEQLMPVTALAGVAVCDAVERVCGMRPGLKWPNDPVLERKKICGILTELIMDPDGRLCLILGIGINVKQRPEDFTPDVAEVAVSLEMVLGKVISREELAAALIEELDVVYEALQRRNWKKYLERYRRDCVNLGKLVQLIGPDGREQAWAAGVDNNFGLVVRMADGTEKTVHSGEVSVRGLYGYVE